MNVIDECHACGGDARLVRDAMEITLGQRSATVAAARFRCDNCSLEFFLPGQMAAAQKLAADEIRTADGLLLPEEIKSIRDSLGVSQQRFEQLIAAGPKTAGRWERGTVFQNGTTDALLRVIRDVPGVAEYLSKANSVELPTIDCDPEPPVVKATPRYHVHFLLDSTALVSPAPDPNIIPIGRYLNKRSPQPIPPTLLREAVL